ncbi:hypothetical protein GYMLUDRAFT_84614 [Collybiopsis luxurians FD-317 M1]|uniref:Uncharacterized protein n=1 Tax=Collybiopsis luxurians FD-317 M1 TaxID=944289 RepID=A0A0D0BDQ6_9AGAR|nr:hypothetical protein GYMLUDRAFT_84614 [Collybiopsis luxurians FD-317 M1]
MSQICSYCSNFLKNFGSVEFLQSSVNKVMSNAGAIAGAVIGILFLLLGVFFVNRYRTAQPVDIEKMPTASTAPKTPTETRGRPDMRNVEPGPSILVKRHDSPNSSDKLPEPNDDPSAMPRPPSPPAVVIPPVPRLLIRSRSRPVSIASSRPCFSRPGSSRSSFESFFHEVTYDVSSSPNMYSHVATLTRSRSLTRLHPPVSYTNRDRRSGRRRHSFTRPGSASTTNSAVIYFPSSDTEGYRSEQQAADIARKRPTPRNDFSGSSSDSGESNDDVD